MKNPTENDFKSKFRLLNSQENSEEIIWSCSDSSDTKHNENLGKLFKTVNRKRKRGKTRKKTSKNTSNIEITFIDLPLKQQNENSNERSPLSPILSNSQRHFVPINRNKLIFDSPVLSSNNSLDNSALKSPILVLKHISPKVSPNVRRNLFNNNNNMIVDSSSEVARARKSCVCTSTQINQKTRLESHVFESVVVKQMFSPVGNNNVKQEIIKSDSKEIKINNVELNEINIEVSNPKEKKKLKLETVTTKATNDDLIEKVKSYFDIQFSSETPSQHSISEYSTPKNSSKSSEEIEIINSLTDMKSVIQNIELEKRVSSDRLESNQEFQIEKSKKFKYKKDGLAHRLNVLLKKQKAHISLWQHERFLARNSNFIMPDDFRAFKILNVCLKHGCYLLEAVDMEDKRFIILINYMYISNDFLEKDKILKLYRPFKILDYRDYKLIVNVSKFECIALETSKR